MNRQAAEILALRVLEWLAASEDELAAFLGASGIAPADLARSAGDPVMQAAVLDHLLQSEERVLAFCAAEGIAPDRPMAARAMLPGGDLPNWT